jgi:hypothetical protein
MLLPEEKMTESYAAKKTVFCNSFMNFEPPTNLMDSSFFEAVVLEEVGNMVFVWDDEITTVHRLFLPRI